MHRPNPTVAATLAGALAVLVGVYVFASGDGPGSGAGQPGAQSPCASQRTYDLIKSELFRQAAALRGADARAFGQLASSSNLRMAAPQLTREDKALGITGCAASLTLVLPAGLAVADGRRSLAGEAGYTTGASEQGEGVTLSADSIVAPLATLSRANRAATPQIARAEPAAAPPPKATGESGPAARAPAARAERSRAAEPAARTEDLQIARGPDAEPVAQPQAGEVALLPAPREAAPVPVAPVAPPARAVPRPPAGPSATAGTGPVRAAPVAAGPSFDCRRARTRSEIAVCRDGRLANLDRQMAGRFNDALSVADSGKRIQLVRSRRVFLRYRDSCKSDACVAGAYRDRMRQIDDIMNERWSPP